MTITKKLKVFIMTVMLMVLNIKDLIALENKILFKIDNQIVTTIDIYEEIKFLKTFNPEVNKLSENELLEISKNSIVRDKIKKMMQKKKQLEPSPA